MSNKISMKKIIVKHLRNLPNTKKQLTVTEANAAAEAILKDTCDHLTERDGEVVMGSVGKLISKRFPEAVRYNPASKKREPRAAYKTVRFRAFKAARTNI